MDLASQRASSRRTVLAAAAGGIAAAVAGMLGRPSSVAAVNGDAVLVGQTRYGSATTAIDTSASPATAFMALSNAGAAVAASSESGYGVYAGSVSSYGVHAASDSSAGVFGTSVSGNGLYGSSVLGIGVQGFAEAAGQTGVFGQCDQGYGVGGYSALGGGTRGGTEDGIGVEGYANGSGTGAGGYSVNGIGVEALSTMGLALKVTGKVKLNRSGRRLAAAGATYLDVPVTGGVTTSNLCFANLATYRTGVYVAAVRPTRPRPGSASISTRRCPWQPTWPGWSWTSSGPAQGATGGRLVALGAWRSLVAHLNGVQEVERSNRSAPTTLSHEQDPPVTRRVFRFRGPCVRRNARAGGGGSQETIRGG